jgi:hypothetical protein
MTSFNSPFTGDVIQPTDVSFRAITLTATTQLSWPINGNATDNYAARIMEVYLTNTAYDLYMPPANQTSVGTDALIRNTGTVALDVKDYLGVNTIVTISPGQSQYIYVTTNATTSGTWGIIAFGIGSSGADAATLAGYGLVAITTTLNQSQPVSTFSSNYTALTSDRASVYAWTGGAGTLTLTGATTLTNSWFMMVRNAGTGTLTVAASGGDLINGSSTISMQPADSCVICCSGTAFYTVGLGQVSNFNFTQLTYPVVSGTYTLTSADAANVIQKYTGTITGNVTIIVPQTVQVYYIQNATTSSGSYTVTITTGVAGSSSATIASNQQSTLICDSINLVNANTVLAGSSSIGLINGTVSAPALYFASESNTGIYRAGTGQFNIAVLGVNLLSLTATGLTISGAGTFTGGISGGTFV